MQLGLIGNNSFDLTLQQNPRHNENGLMSDALPYKINFC